MTPRKPRQRQQHRQQGPTPLVQASEYESDAQAYEQPYNPPPPTRTNNEMNLSVLHRYNPSIRYIVSQAANAVVYTFTPSTEQWEKSGVEGTLFVCAQEPTPETGDESYCLFVLNRRGLDNLILDLGQTQDVEATSELLIMRFQEAGQPEENQKVMGIWIHNNKDDRDQNSKTIQECWTKARASRAERQSINNASPPAFPGGDTGDLAPQPAAMGRRISLTDLFQR